MADILTAFTLVQQPRDPFSPVLRVYPTQGKQPASRQEGEQKAAKAAGDKGVAMDGATIYIRDEGWKELKVGCTFDIEAQPTKDKETGK